MAWLIRPEISTWECEDVRELIRVYLLTYTVVVGTYQELMRVYCEFGRNQVALKVIKFPSSYATKLSPTSSTKANLQKLKANVPNDTDYDVWLPLDLVYEIEINDRMKNSLYGDNLVMDIPNLEGNGYTKETIRIKCKWKPPHCSTCLIYGHSLVDCPKAAPKRVMTNIDKGKRQTTGADDEGFIEVKKKKSCGNNRALNVDNLITEEVAMGSMASTSSTQEKGQKVDYLVNSHSDDEVEHIENEISSFCASKGIGYGPKSLWEQWRDTAVDDEYEPYDDDMYEGREIPKNIQNICDNFDIKVRGQKKK
ncbi:hypothetical protein Tco_0846553 [Tanacetum coccineum]